MNFLNYKKIAIFVSFLEIIDTSMNMKFLKVFALAGAFASIVAVSAKGQNAKDSTKQVRNVQIEREYTPEVTPVTRPTVELQPEEPSIKKSNPAFSKYTKSFQVQPTPLIQLQPEDYGALTRTAPKQGFLRVGAGFLFNWMADFWYPVWNTDEGYFDVRVHHDGIYSLRQRGQDSKKLFNTDLGINFHKNFDDNQLYLSAFYANESFNYYGGREEYPTDNPIKFDSTYMPNQSFNKADFNLGFRTRERNSDDWLWDARLNYRFISTRNHLTEHNINAIAAIDKLIDENAIVAEAGVQTFFYQKRDSLEKLQLPTVYGIDSEEWKTNVIFYLRPAFLWNLDEVRIKLGVNTAFGFGRKPIVAISPDVKIDYLLNDFLNLYAGVGGGFEVNSLWNVTDENRYYNLAGTTHNTYSPFDVFAGVKVKVLKGLMLDAGISYKYVFNEIFYKNNAMIVPSGLPMIPPDTIFNRYFAAEYSNGGKFTANARISYNIKERVNIFASMQFGKWSLKQDPSMLSFAHAWHTPEWIINAGSDFKFGKGFFGNVNFYFLSKMKAEVCPDLTIAADPNHNEQVIVTLPATYDLNLGFGYNINDNFSIFARLNNILALAPKLNAEPWFGYKTMGFNALIGLTAQF